MWQFISFALKKCSPTDFYIVHVSTEVTTVMNSHHMAWLNCSSGNERNAEHISWLTYKQIILCTQSSQVINTFQ